MSGTDISRTKFTGPFTRYNSLSVSWNCCNRKSLMAVGQFSGTSRRTASPKSRSRSSFCTAWRRLLKSSSSTISALSRVRRNWWQPFTFMPRKSLYTYSCRMDDRNTKPSRPSHNSAGSFTTRGKMRGACTMAMPEARPNASLPSSSTTKFNDLFNKRGNGCEASSPMGVRIGSSSRLK